MRKILLAAVLAVSLAACATPQPAPLAAYARGHVTGVATLAIWGTWEMELAPAYTRQIVLLNRATRALEAGQIDVATAIEIRTAADRARQLLDASRRGHATQPTALQRASLADAQHQLYLAEQLLENHR